MGDVDGAQLERTSLADITALLPGGSLFILEGPGPLSCCSFNARLPDMVQIGNVWTPPALRGNGYARAVVAGALEIAKNSGISAAVLSTGRKNIAAQAAYRSIGFELVGDYATVRLASDTQLPVF
jgi:predicted GNAT family acetyltransferase